MNTTDVIIRVQASLRRMESNGHGNHPAYASLSRKLARILVGKPFQIVDVTKETIGAVGGLIVKTNRFTKDACL
ncbi:MAG: hypothetical protein ACOH5I_21995 [Oligoflexus sp.]